jgi:hypothetical protein
MAAAGPVLSPLELTRRRRAWAGWVRLGRLERAGLAVLALTTAVAVLAPLLAPYSHHGRARRVVRPAGNPWAACWLR